jgi:amino acid transporter
LKRQLTLLHLIGLIYFTVSGGAFGLEDLVSQCGPGLAILLLLLTPVFWSLPIALVTAELGSMMPWEGGYYRWVTFGLGRFCGFLEGWWTWLYTFVDMSIYPVLFTAYLNALLGFLFPQMGEWSWATRWGVCWLVIITSLMLNLLGARVVANSALVSLVAVSLPFLVLGLLGLSHWKHSPVAPWVADPETGLFSTLGTGLAVVMWNYMGWDNVSTYAGEVQDPRRNFPLALLISVVLVTLLYLIPMVAALSSTDDWRRWDSQEYTIAQVASKAFGNWLGVAISMAVLWSLFSLFNSQLLYASRIPFAMAEDGLLPTWITRCSSGREVPWVSLVLCCGIYGMFGLLSFEKLVIINVLLYSIAMALEFVTLIVLRIRHESMPRPFRIPLGTLGVILASGSFLAFAIVAFYFTYVGEKNGSRQLTIAGLMLLTGPLVYSLSIVQSRWRATENAN